MGLERRGNRLYFYRKEKLNGKVISHYCGPEPFGKDLGEAIAFLERIENEQAREERQRLEAEQWQRMEQEDAPYIKQDRQVMNLVKAVLLASGYHTHKGQW